MDLSRSSKLDPVMVTMADRIKTLRQAKGSSQEELADLVGVTKSAVSQWELGTTENIKLRVFLHLCDVLGTNPWYLVHGHERAKSGQTGTFQRLK